ncbi:MAG: site-2 protease family protein, partial [Candidatus Buchananbacteria bacterium]|nr:site-2 protease family protein [Candidatus Buchananbacteria bacterium]
HAFMMRQYGVAIKEICLLGLGPKLASFKWPKVFGQTLLTVRLIPLGAFVKPESSLEESVTPQRLEHIFAAGIAANFVYAGILALVYTPLACYYEPHMMTEIMLAMPLVILLCIGIGVAMWKFPTFANWVVITIGMLALAFLVYVCVRVPFWKALGGPITIGSEIASIESYRRGVDFAFIMSINLLVVNALPLPPLDGGNILLSLLKRKQPILMQRYGTPLELVLVLGALTFIVLALGSDIMSLF